MERFWAKVDKGEGCWEWRGWTDPKGYGRIQARDGRPREEYVHRLVYAVLVGPIPAGACILHSCDNPPCVNPAHLRIGTRIDNVADREARGRTARGDRAGQTKLSDAAVVQVREEAAAGAALTDLAVRFGVTRQTVRNVATGQYRPFVAGPTIAVPNGRKRIDRPMPSGPRRPPACVHGHPFDVLNTYVGLDGKRKCRRCRRENGQRRRVA